MKRLVIDTLEIKETTMMINILDSDLEMGEVVTSPDGQEWAAIGVKGATKPQWLKRIVANDVSNTWS